MQQLWDEKGYTGEDVLAASVEVDRLLNAYDRIKGYWIALHVYKDKSAWSNSSRLFILPQRRGAVPKVPLDGKIC